MLNEWFEALTTSIPGLDIECNVPMAKMTTLRLGGPADLLCTPDSTEMLQKLLYHTNKMGIPVLIIGNGSNMLVKDGGIRGVVINMRTLRKIETNGTRMIAQAGAMLSVVSKKAADNSLAGLAFASGIPGTVGGATMMNAGAYGGEMSQVVTNVECLTFDGTPVHYEHEEMRFSHRSSILQQQPAVVTSVTFDLTPGNKKLILEEMARLNKQRAEKQPLTIPNAGSMFKRPPNAFAAALIDQCGLRGMTVGGAQVSEKHAGFGLNIGGTSADFEAMLAKVQQIVYKQKGVRLELEIRIVGEDAQTE